MKQILIIDESPLFREYLRLKLADNGIEVSVGINAMDGISKMRNMAPDLIIMDYHLSKQGYMEVLKQKKANPNTVKTPVIILAQRIDQRRLIELVPFGVKKVFTKPVKIDALFITLSELLGVPFNIDESPGIVEVHVNDDIIFIELAQGLNRDKLDLLRFKIIELIELYEIRVPKVIVMLSDIKLSFADAPNMQKLLETVLQASRAKLHYIRVLTKDEFARQFIEGQKEYSGIEVVSNLQYAMDGLLQDIEQGMEYAEKKAELIGEKVLSAGNSTAEESMALKFDAEAKSFTMEDIKESVQNLRIAVIDDDFIIQELIKNTFQKTGATVTTFSDGGEFIAAVDTEEFDLAFLDLMMPKVDGFEVLKALQSRDIRYPVIVLSAVTQRETVIKAYQMGIKSYLVKPLKPEDIFKKSMEILKANF
ncbi:response regulator [Leadbettera azotonutricia]|uniref:Response regulator n=1 Tax=Leadbettera azotonutricia (strain ATCC BAA-888 / DSM 13862 / ZAS-9) TaxID=545695 RepID=F5Y9X4_LEAAZ|nr:response regulator [Leadbettera azotonutricia]AEF81370.1 response regulator [Leadbettera azotonutricia ZAS-9]